MLSFTVPYGTTDVYCPLLRILSLTVLLGEYWRILSLLSYCPTPTYSPPYSPPSLPPSPLLPSLPALATPEAAARPAELCPRSPTINHTQRRPSAGSASWARRPQRLRLPRSGHAATRRHTHHKNTRKAALTKIFFGPQTVAPQGFPGFPPPSPKIFLQKGLYILTPVCYHEIAEGDRAPAEARHTNVT